MIKSLYVHIPFCLKKCLYCDFNSYPTLMEYEDEYIDALVREIKTIKQSKFETIFVGGGTPTILSLKSLEKLLQSLKNFEAEEYTFECNPGTINHDKLDLLKAGGVNRLSIGLQAWQDRLLKGLGRIHSLREFLDSYNVARKSGFNNINIDLMFAIPEQKNADWVETLNNVAALKPEHLSCYSLIIEEGTPYYSMYENGKLEVADEDTERNMYYNAKKILGEFGYNQYEISNFSVEGKKCRHNITYWMDEEYIGVGAGAHSYVNGERYFNFSKIGDYIKRMKSAAPIEEINKLTVKDEMSEVMFLGLRMTKGVKKTRFQKRFGIDIYEVYGAEIIELINLGLMIDKDGYLRLTEYGIDVSNQVFIKFIK